VSGASLKAFAPLADLSDAERDELAELLEERELSPGETLFAEGDDADAMVLVQEGSVRISSERTSLTASLGSGSVIGALSLFAVGARETTAVGDERAQVRLLRRAEFLRLAEDSPRIACRIASALVAELAGQARAALGSLAAASVDPVGAGE
jgi:CRP-like cAMP-binding protein